MKDIKYKEENEIRLLCDDIYNNDKYELGGRVFPNKKQLLDYKGHAFPLKQLNLKVEKVLIPLQIQYREILLNICQKNNYKVKLFTL